MTYKTHSILVLCSLILIDLSPAQRRTTAPGGGGSGSGRARAAAAELLDHNLTIKLSGSLANGNAIDMAMTGCGKKFTAETTSGTVEIGDSKVPLITTVDFTVSQKDEAYIISYSIGTREPVPSSTSSSASNTGTVTNISYHDVVIRGTTRCEPGEPVNIFSSGEKDLTLTASKEDA